MQEQIVEGFNGAVEYLKQKQGMDSSEEEIEGDIFNNEVDFI